MPEIYIMLHADFILIIKNKNSFIHVVAHIRKKKEKKIIECNNALFLPDHTYIAILYPYQFINGEYLYS